MKKFIFIALSIAFVIAIFDSSLAQDADFKGSKDHPLLSRMPDFHISSYKESEFGSYKFLDKDRKQVPIEGHTYYYEYRINQGASSPGELKIRRNVQDALKKIGGKVIYDENFNRVSTVVVTKGNKETWLEVRSYDNMYRLNIVEKEIMEQEMTADAAAMGNDINATGHVSIYGIFFDTGKSELKPESDLAIAEIAKLLNNDKSLNIYIVGHTDNVGSFESNMKLSQERAGAVIKSLIDKHGIAASRLKSYGVASLSPVASNDTDEGKAKNRRVELVKQ